MDCHHLNGHRASLAVSASTSTAGREPLGPKVIATLKARAALCGVVLYHLDGDNGRALFAACKWAMTKQMGSVAEVEDFLNASGRGRELGR